MLGLVLRSLQNSQICRTQMKEEIVMEKILSKFLKFFHNYNSLYILDITIRVQLPETRGYARSRKHAPHRTLLSGKGSVDIFELRVSKEPRNRCYVCRNDLVRSYKSCEQKARGIAFRVYCASLLIKIDGLSKPAAAARTTNAIYGTLYCSCVDEF